jgi:tape measure domain-containing protein
MNTDNGSLSFDAYINNSQFKKQIDDMEKRIRGISDTSVKEGKKMEDAFSKVGAAVGSYFGYQALQGFTGQLIKVRGEFQQLGVAFETMLGSKEQADALMAQQVEFAAKTPFTLTEVATNTKQLMAMGVATEDVMKTMKALGDVASGVSVPISRVAINYGQVMTLGKLQGREIRDFAMAGIPIIDELAKMLGKTKSEILDLSEAGDITAAMTTEAFMRMSSEGGKFYNLMQKQSLTLTGQISNLQDAYDQMLNSIGASTEGVMYGAIQGTKTLIENYELVGKIILGLIATYGAYRTALIVATVASKGYTMAEQAQYVTLLMVEKAQAVLNKTMLANPYVAAAVAVTALVAGLMIYTSTVNNVNQAEEAKARAQEKASKQYEEQKVKIEALTSVLNNEKIGLQERKKALKEIQDIIPGYHANLTQEGKLINNNTEAISGYLKELEKQIYLTAIMDEKIELTKKKRLQEKELTKRETAAAQAEASARETRMSGGSSFGTMPGSGADMMSSQSKSFVESTKRELKSTTDALKALDDEYVKFSNTVDKKPISTTPAESEEEKKKRLSAQKKANDELKKNIEDFNEFKLDAQKKLEEEEFNLLKSGIEDKKVLIDLDLKNTIEQIDEQEQLYKKKAKLAKISNPDTSVYDLMRATATDQAKADKAKIDQEETQKLKEKLDGFLEKYQTYQGQLLAIEKAYIEESKILNDALANAKTEAEKKQIEDSIKARNQAYTDEKSKIKVDELMASPDWTRLFSDLSKVTTQEMIKLKDKIEAQFSDLNLDPKDLEALRAKLNEVNNEIQQRNPFLALSEAIKRYKKESSSLNFKELMKSVSGSIEAVSVIFDQVVGSLDKLGIKTDEETNQILGNVSEILKGSANLSMGIATGNPMQIIQGSIDIISNGIDLIAGAKDRKLNRSIKQHQEEVVKLKDAYDDLARAVDKALGSDRYNSQKALIQNLTKQQQEYAAMASEERQKKKADDGKIKEYQNSVKQNSYAIQDAINSIREDILGGSVKSIADDLGNALIDAFSAGENAAASFGKKVDDIVGNVIRKMIVQKLVEQPIGNVLNRYMAQWVDSSGNFLGFDAVMGSAEQMGTELKGLSEGMSAALATLPDDIRKYFTGDAKAGSASPLTGAIQAVSQETASIISGQMNAMRINQVEALDVLRNQLLSLNRIALNTAHNVNLSKLGEMLDVLKTISNNNNLRSQGL